MPRDLRGFIKQLEDGGQLRRITALVDPDLEIAEIAQRMLQCGGPGLLFENVKGSLSSGGQSHGDGRSHYSCHEYGFGG